MYYISWRGYGLVGFLPPVLGVVALGCLSDYPIRVAVLGAGVAIAMTGLALVVVGRVLNRNGNHHALYGIPLWICGAVQMALGLALAGWVVYLVTESGWKKDSLSLDTPPAITLPVPRPIVPPATAPERKTPSP